MKRYSNCDEIIASFLNLLNLNLPMWEKRDKNWFWNFRIQNFEFKIFNCSSWGTFILSQILVKHKAGWFPRFGDSQNSKISLELDLRRIIEVKITACIFRTIWRTFYLNVRLDAKSMVELWTVFLFVVWNQNSTFMIPPYVLNCPHRWSTVLWYYRYVELAQTLVWSLVLILEKRLSLEHIIIFAFLTRTRCLSKLFGRGSQNSSPWSPIIYITPLQECYLSFRQFCFHKALYVS